MKENIEELKSEFQAKLLFWNNIKSKKIKVAFIVIFLGLIGLKVITTMLTIDWLAGLMVIVPNKVCHQNTLKNNQ